MWNIIHSLLSNLGYPQIIILMAMESTFLPVPSELVVPPAAYRAYNGDLNIVLVVLCSTLGSLLGATINYLLGLLLGRSLIHYLADTKVAHLLLINKEKVIKAEQYFIHYGKSSTFIGRLVPGVRHLISIPAGISKMHYLSFALFTVLGSFIWSSVLAVLGYVAGANKNLLHLLYKDIKLIFFALFALFIVFLIYKGLQIRKRRKLIRNS
jgi:membrane protein DedA with SNARE-associated domain